MNFDSERLLYKEISWADLDFIHYLHSIKEVDEYNTLGIPENLEETRNVLRPIIENQNSTDKKLYSWIIVKNTSNHSIGLSGLNLTGDRFKMGEIYFKLLPAYWGKGYATETSRKLIEFGFNILKLHRIEAGVSTENIRSIKVLEKSGMICEGIRRKILPIRGEWKDNFHYAILEDDQRDY